MPTCARGGEAIVANRAERRGCGTARGGDTTHGPSRGKKQGTEGGAARVGRVGHVEWAMERGRGKPFSSFFLFSIFPSMSV